jgi:hypothetical protein
MPVDKLVTFFRAGAHESRFTADQIIAHACPRYGDPFIIIAGMLQAAGAPIGNRRGSGRLRKRLAVQSRVQSAVRRASAAGCEAVAATVMCLIANCRTQLLTIWPMLSNGRNWPHWVRRRRAQLDPYAPFSELLRMSQPCRETAARPPG